MTIGETLRRERLRRNLSLEQISHQTKISVRLLQAIEAEDFEKLPGGVFTKSFVRQYARVLGLDEDEIASELEQIFQPVDTVAPLAEESVEPPIRVPPLARWEALGSHSDSNSSLPALALVVAVMLVCSAVYAWWQRARRPVMPTAPPAIVETAGEKPVPPPASRVSAALPESGALQNPEAQPAPAVPRQASAGATNASMQEASRTGVVHVTLTAQEPVWVAAYSDGKRVLYETLQPNQTKVIEASEKVRLLVGNAGGLEVSLNGKALGAIGPKGQVRVVELTPAGFQVNPREMTPAAADTL